MSFCSDVQHHVEATVNERSTGTCGDGERFLLIAGDGHFSSHVLRSGHELVFGRDPSCDVILEHPMISRRHVRVRVDAVISVEDAGSTNGVRIGGNRLVQGERAPLEIGASFRFGPFSALLLGGPSPGNRSSEGRATLLVRDPAAAQLPDVVVRIAASNVSVLIRGETGVGKDVLARAVHARSGRTGPFVSINCAAISESLLESELFGHERGAFTGAVQGKQGLFEAADKGTVFLDEIGELPLAVQAKLLRAVETHQVLRVGGVKPVDLDVRFIAATHRALHLDVARGAFRQDLLFRLNGITLLVPPLRERREAIPVLAHEFLEAACARAGRARCPTLSLSALGALGDHDWPGNVRELKAVVERALLLAPGNEITSRHIAIDSPAVLAPAPAAPPPVEVPATPALPRSRRSNGDAPADADAERARLVAALELFAGNQTEAARHLGISRATMVQKLRVHRIPRPRRG